MSLSLNEAISVIYQHGSRIKLTDEWRDKNIICPNSKIYYVLDGELCVEIDGKEYTARRGDALLVPAGTRHSYYLTELGYAEKYWFHFDLRLGLGNYFDRVRLPYLKRLGVSEELIGLFDDVVARHAQGGAAALLASGALLRIISLYSEGAELTEPKKDNDETDAVIAYIKKNYSERLTLETLSDMARLTPNYFTKKFKEKTGHTPLKYVNILRVERAKFLLEHTVLSISEIMESVGFLDSAHFSKLFKAATGYSPSKFRWALSQRKSR